MRAVDAPFNNRSCFWGLRGTPQARTVLTAGLRFAKENRPRTDERQTGRVERGPVWAGVMGVRRCPVREIQGRDIPKEPGVYIWFRNGAPVYVGKASGVSGLRSRLRAHRQTGQDLSRSTLRSWVAVEQLGLERSVTRARPSIMTAEQIRVVNDWLSGCELRWVICETRADADRLEAALREEWRPPLNHD